MLLAYIFHLISIIDLHAEIFNNVTIMKKKSDMTLLISYIDCHTSHHASNLKHDMQYEKYQTLKKKFIKYFKMLSFLCPYYV